jgi:hypothetical protein
VLTNSHTFKFLKVREDGNKPHYLAIATLGSQRKTHLKIINKTLLLLEQIIFSILAGTPIQSQSFNGYHTRDEPLPPDFTLCFEPLWSDHSSPHSQKADKAFLSSDALGQKYLCYLFSSKVHSFMFSSRCTRLLKLWGWGSKLA